MKYTVFSQMILCAIDIKNTIYCTGVWHLQTYRV